MLQLSNEIQNLFSSKTVKLSLVNSTYSVVDFLALPLLLIITTPYFVAKLGIETFGIWMLVNSIVGTLGGLTPGLGDAVVKHVVSYSNKGDWKGVSRVINATLRIYFILGGGMALLVYLTAPLLITYAFHISADNLNLTVSCIRIAALGIWIRSIESVFSSAMRARQRYDLTAIITLIGKVLAIVLSVYLVYQNTSILYVIAISVIVNLVSLFVHWRVCIGEIPELLIAINVERGAMSEIMSFGIYSWIQGIGSVIFSQADKLIVGASLGAKDLAVYTICLQVAQPIHAVIAAGLNFVFPLISSRIETDGPNIRSIYNRCLKLNIFLAFSATIGILLLGKPFLNIWMGAKFSNDSYITLFILGIAFGMLAINIVAHYTLLGLGKARYVAYSNIAGGLLMVIGAYLLIPVFGLSGAALGRLMYGPVISINLAEVSRCLH